MKKKKTDDRKNVIITILVVLVLILGVCCIMNMKKEKAEYFSLSHISIPDGDFTKEFNFKYDNSIIRVNMLSEENKIEITPIKEGNTTLKISYITTTGEEKSITHEIGVHSRLFSEIDND